MLCIAINFKGNCSMGRPVCRPIRLHVNELTFGALLLPASSSLMKTPPSSESIKKSPYKTGTSIS